MKYIISLISISLFLVSCGQMGSLYLPKQKTHITQIQKNNKKSEDKNAQI